MSEHVHRFMQALEVWTHPWWRQMAHDDIDAYCAFVREETDLRLGIEADFVPGREDRMASLLDAREWDYVVGSVHFLRDEAVDMRGSEWDVWRSSDPEKVWARYFETLGEAARTGMFDILAHPDLVKVWGGGAPVPDGDLRRFYELAMDGIAESDVAIEVSTAGLRKPVGRDLPGARRSWRCASRPGGRWRCPATPTCPRTSGHEYDRAVEWLGELGVDGAGRVRAALAAAGAARMSARAGHRLRLAPLRGGPAAGARRRGGARGRARPRRATPTPTCSPTR